MSTATTEGPIRTTLIDIANCIGCRACQVACKQWNEKDGEKTELEDQLGFQNPATLSAKTLLAHTESQLHRRTPSSLRADRLREGRADVASGRARR